MTQYDNSFIFVISGYDQELKELNPNFDMYIISDDIWISNMHPYLNTPRINHSSCISGNTLAVFGGYNNELDQCDQFLNSIEIIDAKRLISGNL